MQLSIASHLRCLIKRFVVFMTVVHSYFYIVVYTQQGCRTLKMNLSCVGKGQYVASGVHTLLVSVYY